MTFHNSTDRLEQRIAILEKQIALLEATLRIIHADIETMHKTNDEAIARLSRVIGLMEDRLGARKPKPRTVN